MRAATAPPLAAIRAELGRIELPATGAERAQILTALAELLVAKLGQGAALLLASALDEVCDERGRQRPDNIPPQKD